MDSLREHFLLKAFIVKEKISTFPKSSHPNYFKIVTTNSISF